MTIRLPKMEITFSQWVLLVENKLIEDTRSVSRLTPTPHRPHQVVPVVLGLKVTQESDPSSVSSFV